MIIDEFVGEVLIKTTEIIENFFSGYNEHIYGKPGTDDLMFADEIRDIVKKYTRNEDIIFNIPYEIETLTNTLINGMYYTTITSKLDAKYMINFISRTIEKHVEDSLLILRELEKESNFRNYRSR